MIGWYLKCKRCAKCTISLEHCGQNSFSHRAAVKSIQNQSKHRFIYLSPYLRKLVFNNYDYDEQALLNKLAGTIFQK